MPIDYSKMTPEEAAAKKAEIKAKIASFPPKKGYQRKVIKGWDILRKFAGLYDPTGKGDPALGLQYLAETDPDARKMILGVLALGFERAMPAMMDEDAKEVELAKVAALPAQAQGGQGGSQSVSVVFDPRLNIANVPGSPQLPQPEPSQLPALLPRPAEEVPMPLDDLREA